MSNSNEGIEFLKNFFEIPSIEWEIKYFQKFRFWTKSINSKKDLTKLFLQFTQENENQYLKETISPLTFSYLSFISKVIELILKQPTINHELTSALISKLIFVSFSKKEMAGYLSALKSDLDVLSKKSSQVKSPEKNELEILIQNRYDNSNERDFFDYSENMDLPGFLELPKTFFMTLLDFNQVDVIKDLIIFIYSSYKEKLNTLIERSDSENLWKENIKQLLPYLLIKSFFPIHHKIKTNNPTAYLAENADEGEPHAMYHSGERIVCAFINHIFEEQEIIWFQEEDKKITESFAHIFSVTLNYLKVFEDSIAEINHVRKEKGEFKAMQKALILYRMKHRLPKYLFKEIEAKLIKY